jgi:hypothetical protein
MPCDGSEKALLQPRAQPIALPMALTRVCSVPCPAFHLQNPGGHAHAVEVPADRGVARPSSRLKAARDLQAQFKERFVVQLLRRVRSCLMIGLLSWGVGVTIRFDWKWHRHKMPE